MGSSLPFISSKNLHRQSDVFDEFGCSEAFINFLISELIDLEGSSEIGEGYLSLSESLLMLTRDHVVILKKIIFYGMHYGINKKNSQILIDTLSYIDLLFKKLGISSSDRLSLCSAKICANFELFSLTRDATFLDHVVKDFHVMEQLLKINPHLDNNLGWQHFRQGEKHEETSCSATGYVYEVIGKTFLTIYYKNKEKEDLVRSSNSFSKVLSLLPHRASAHADYAECLQILGLELGNSSYLQRAIDHLSKAIFLSFNRHIDNSAYENYRYSYAVAKVRLFDLTYEKEHFHQANRILYQTVQAFPHIAELWVLWGELLIRSGWLNSNMKHVEMGLDKLASAQKKGADPIILSALLANGIAVLGLYLDEPNLFRESRIRLVAAMRAFPGNSHLIHALGVVQLCSALYFSDDANFAASASCFKSCIEWDSENINSWQKLFDVYFAWGVRKKNVRLLQKAVEVVKRLCSLRPEVFLFWSDRGLALKCLAEATTDLVYKEIYLEESLLYYRKAWDLTHRMEILELWGHSCYLLADLQESQDYYDEAYSLLSSIDEERQSFRAKIILASTLLGKGKLLQDQALVEEALIILNSLIDEYPDQEDLLLLLGEAWLFLFWKRRSLESEELVRVYLEQAIALGCSEAYYTLGKFYAVKKEIGQAWAMVMRSVDFGFKITESRWLNDPCLANLRAGHAFHEVVANQRGKLWWANKTEAKRN
ncbi:tetratricopeptide repeat protein [Chlamydia sp. 04-14]|uniref:tetratricopeptide repeat protein n=1 Tax=Chlamydia TaxID=810 RepID=UPI002FC67893